jgi:2-C-methyl-D-erythritol 2,4-cyclodiphosphate synthase
MADRVPRVGLGFDVHAWAAGRPLVLGGVRFDSESGVAAHSDGDVVCHAIGDAVLGAAGLGDLGSRFPDDAPAFAGIAGTELLSRVVEAVAEAGWRVASCDATVICDRPAIAPEREAMRDALAASLRCDPSSVSLKATRPEGLGLAGDGVGCMAVAVLA